jgi:hypothetical protein
MMGCYKSIYTTKCFRNLLANETGRGAVLFGKETLFLTSSYWLWTPPRLTVGPLLDAAAATVVMSRAAISTNTNTN